MLKNRLTIKNDRISPSGISKKRKYRNLRSTYHGRLGFSVSCLNPVPSTLNPYIIWLHSYNQHRRNIILSQSIRINKQHVHHPYCNHCSMVRNFNHNRKKQNHRWYDESTRGVETPQWWNIQINFRYIQRLWSSWQRIWRDHIYQSSTKEVDIPHGLVEG